jgi:predicted enzyme related to lactoylglutathione lyase
LHHSVGSFCIAELHTPAPELSAAFYGDLLGWRVRQISDTYWMFHSGNVDVVGMRRAEMHRWVACVRVDNVESVITRAQAVETTIVTPAADTPGVARTAILRDPEGAVIGLWEPRGVEGTMLETGPGSLWWVELATGAMAGAQRRYASLFDWGVAHTTKFENGPLGYTLFKVGERSVGGAFQFDADWGVSAAWQVYFEVTDFEASAARACALGGEQGFWRDAPNAGRIGVLTDPGDGLFLIAQPLAPTATVPTP